MNHAHVAAGKNTNSATEHDNCKKNNMNVIR